MELTELYNRFISEGYNQFCINGVGGPISDDVYCLGFNNPDWVVYYVERGQRSEPVFSTKDQQEAIDYYSNLVSKIDHWHLVVFSRSIEKLNEYKTALEAHRIRTIQNDIPDFSVAGDRVYRLFVVNKDIFEAKKVWAGIPYFDNDLGKYRT